jgi:DNA-binding transcriptional LysR family regulator
MSHCLPPSEIACPAAICGLHVHDAEAAQSEIMSANTEPSGILRLTAPIIFGEVVVAPGLVQFLQRYPKIQADLHFSDERINIIAEGYDLAIRMGQIEDREPSADG